MEGNVALRVVAALLAFGGAAVLGSAVARRLAKRYRSAAYSIGGEKNRAGWVSWLVRNGVGLMRSVARAVLRNARVRASVANLLTAVEGIGFIATEESLLSLVLTAMLIVGVGGSALTAAPICGVALALCVAAACAIYAKSSEDKRRERMREAVPDALRSMAVSLMFSMSALRSWGVRVSSISILRGRQVTACRRDMRVRSRKEAVIALWLVPPALDGCGQAFETRRP